LQKLHRSFAKAYGVFTNLDCSQLICEVIVIHAKPSKIIYSLISSLPRSCRELDIEHC
jgi:hypothetical protein